MTIHKYIYNEVTMSEAPGEDPRYHRTQAWQDDAGRITVRVFLDTTDPFGTNYKYTYYAEHSLVCCLYDAAKKAQRKHTYAQGIVLRPVVLPSFMTSSRTNQLKRRLI